MVFIFLVPVVNLVFWILWSWKIYEQRNYPGWLSLAPILMLIPFLSLVGWIVHLVIWGLVAWNDR